MRVEQNQFVFGKTGVQRFAGFKVEHHLANVHGAGFRDDVDQAHVPPIHMATVFEFKSVADMAATFRGERAGWIYTRYGNPTLDLVERHLARLEGAEASLALSSGMAAICSTIGWVVTKAMRAS